MTHSDITVISDVERVDVGFICDREMVDDPWHPVNGLHHWLGELLAAPPGSV